MRRDDCDIAGLLAAGAILVPPGVISAYSHHFSVEGVVALGYTDSAYIFLSLWLCYGLEKMHDTVSMPATKEALV